jgi:prepilin-type processing-associated H-X9-DG protein
MSPDVRGSRAAFLAFLLGLLSLCLSLPAALPAVYLGLRSLRALNAREGETHGRRFAIAGMVLGAFTTTATLVGAGVMVLILLQQQSNRVGCTNNLREIGLALNVMYEQRGDHFPQATIPNAALPPEKRLSWLAALGPFLPAETPVARERRKLFGTIAEEKAWDAPANASVRQANVTAYLCPSYFRDYRPAPGLTSYVGVAGIDPDATALPKSSGRAGLFGYDRVIARSDISAGISSTMAVVETTRDNGSWLAGGAATVRGLDPEESRYIGFGRPFGGLHPRGLNVLWADASVRFLKETIAAADFRAAAVLARGEE